MKVIRDQQKFFTRIINESEAPHNVVLVEGARQVGKTTFIQQTLNACFQQREQISINLEENLAFRNDLDLTNSFEEFELLMKLRGFDPQKRQIIFMDEAQESEKLGYYVRFMKEKWPLTQTILSGSSMTRLFRKNQRYPVGRVTLLKLNPFSFLEFLQAIDASPLRDLCQNFEDESSITPLFHKKLLEMTDAYLRVGGLPDVVLDYANQKDFKTTRRSILLSQQEDFIRKSSIEDKDLFMSALSGVANHLGSVSKYTHISTSNSQATKIVSILKAWHIIAEVEQKGISNTTNFYPKRYLYDIGIAQDVRNIPFPQISILKTLSPALRTQLGGLFENLLYLQLNGYKMGQIGFSGWKESNKNQVEVDFIFHGNPVVPVECKSSLKVTKRSFSGLIRYLTQSDQKIAFLVSASPFQFIEQKEFRLINLPIYLATPEIIERLANKYS